MISENCIPAMNTSKTRTMLQYRNELSSCTTCTTSTITGNEIRSILFHGLGMNIRTNSNSLCQASSLAMKVNHPLQRSGAIPEPEPTIHRCPAAFDLLSIGDPFFDMPLVDEKNFKWEGGYWKQIQLQQKQQQLVLQEPGRRQRRRLPRKRRQRRRSSIGDVHTFKRERVLQKVMEQPLEEAEETETTRQLSTTPMAVNVKVGDKLEASGEKCYQEQIRCLTPRWESTDVTNHNNNTDWTKDNGKSSNHESIILESQRIISSR